MRLDVSLQQRQTLQLKLAPQMIQAIEILQLPNIDLKDRIDLELAENEAVVIDERAGTDPVATGILRGVDRTFIVAEPSVQSMRVAGQIAHELELAGVPFSIIANKAQPDSLFDALSHPPVARIPFGASIPREHLVELTRVA